MKILHTSDWHLGHQLYQQKRDDEHRAFLDWLLKTVKENAVELLLVAGDVFDTGLPSNYALEMYYSFLARAAGNGCRQVIVVGGNHDSPATLQAPKPVLKAINVTIVGAADVENPGKDLVEVRDAAGIPRALVCPVPYLRDRDVYFPKFGESEEVRTRGIVDGTAAYYRAVANQAVERRRALGVNDLPIVATGHLFAQGMTRSGTERDLYVGNLGLFPVERFPPEFAYVALGHLHRPQVASGHAHVRYSGSPLPCAFDEAVYEKKVFLFDSGNPAAVGEIAVPSFRPLIRAQGTLAAIGDVLAAIPEAPLQPWVEVIYEGNSLVPDLQERVLALAEKGAGRVLACKDRNTARTEAQAVPAIDEMTPAQVFELRLAEVETVEGDRETLRKAFQELLLQVQTGARE